MKQTGSVSFWNVPKGYGFILPDGEDKDVFAHISELPPGTELLVVGDKVTFDVGLDKHGRPRALNIAPLTHALKDAAA